MNSSSLNSMKKPIKTNQFVNGKLRDS